MRSIPNLKVGDKVKGQRRRDGRLRRVHRDRTGRRGSDPCLGNVVEPASAFGSGVHESRRRGGSGHPDARPRRTARCRSASSSSRPILGPTSSSSYACRLALRTAKVRNFTELRRIRRNRGGHRRPDPHFGPERGPRRSSIRPSSRRSEPTSTWSYWKSIRTTAA